MAANGGQLPMKKYIELGINFLRLKVLNVGFLIFEEPNRILDKKHKSKLLGIIGWNLIWLAYKVFVEKYGGEIFNSFECLAGLNPLLFSQLCLYHYAEVSNDHDCAVHFIYHQTDMETKYTPSKSAHLAKNIQLFFIRKDGLLGQVMICTKQQSICITSNPPITILGHTNKLSTGITCLVEQAEHHNLLLCIVINQCVANLEG